MKQLHNFVLLGIIFFYFSFSYGQTPTVSWDKTLGGNGTDELYSIIPTADGGFLLAGNSDSAASGDKTEDSKGSWDYWIVKTDVNGNKEWDKTIGGYDVDFLTSVIQTTDGGYLLGGYSISGAFYDKTENSKGHFDYWIVKTDANGNIEWDKTIGGVFYDYLSSVIQTTDGGYLLGGSSNSRASGDKTEDAKANMDYWIVKTDASGNIEWDRTIGGATPFSGNTLKSVIQTTDGGYLLAGESGSDASGDKTENSKGSIDYWIVKIDTNGNIDWDKTLGGNSADYVRSIIQTSDGGYLVGGHSTSTASGDKTENSKGYEDYWIIKTDVAGNKEWDKTIGGSQVELLSSIIENIDGEYLVGGSSSSDYWIVKMDTNGNIDWDKTLGGNSADYFTSIIQTIDGGYLSGGYSNSIASGDKTEDSKGYSDFWIVKIEPTPCTSTLTFDEESLVDITAECEIIELTAPTATNGCGDTITATSEVTLPINEQGITEITWQYEFEGEILETQTQKIILEDVTKPTVVTENLTLELQADGTALITTSDIDNNSYDNCDQDIILSLDRTEFNCSDIENPVTVTLTATDVNENSATGTAVVTVVDKAPPTIEAPAAVIANTSDDGMKNCSTDVDLGQPVYSDNCDGATVAIIVAGNEIDPIYYKFEYGITEVIWQITDKAGNIASDTQLVTVVDDIGYITAPAAIETTTSFDATGNCTAMIDLGDPVTGYNCSEIKIEVFVDDVKIDPTAHLFPVGTTLVTWVKTDAIDLPGRMVSDTQTVIITDDEIPTITAPAAVTANTSDDGMKNCSTDVDLGQPVYSDNCDGATVAIIVAGNEIDPIYYKFEYGITEVIWQITDKAGNIASDTQLVTVVDDIGYITAPAAIETTTSFDATGNCTAMIDLGDPVTGYNCSEIKIEVFVDDVKIDPTAHLFPVGTTLVTWVKTDAIDLPGRMVSDTQTVIITDDENPTITAPVAVTANTSDDGIDNCSTTVTLGTPTTSDNCSGETYKAFVDGTEIPTNTYAFAKGKTTVTWVVTDVAGNTASADQLVTVVDDENPTITAPVAVTANTSDDGVDECSTTVTLGTPTTSDNCSGETYKAFVDGTEIPTDTYAFAKGETTVTWVVTDVAGNTASANQLVTVVDDENPTITAPVAVTANTSDDGINNCSTTVTLGTPATSDNCAGETYRAFVDGTEIPTDTYAFAKGETTVTWTVTDIADRTASDTQLVTVVDDEDPTITAPIAVTANTSDDDTGDCFTTVVLGSPTTSDNCPGETYKAFVDATEIDPATYLFDKGETTITWTVTDAAGNTASADQLVTVVDDENPTITAPVAVTANTSDDGIDNCSTTVSLGTPTTSDNCSGETYKAFVDGTEIPTDTYAFAKGETTVTWTVTDAAGNTASADQLVTVVDDENPTITAPGAVTANTSDDGIDNCSTTVSLGTPTTSDNCSGETYKAFVDGTEIPTDTYAFAKGETTVTWVVTDVAGNTASTDQLVTVVDDENPTITAPVAVTANTSDDGIDNCSTTVSLGTPTTTDNCSGETYKAFVSANEIDPATYAFVKGETTVTWTVTDVAGNTASADQLITVVDDEKPTITAPAAVTANTSDDGVDNCSTTVVLGTPTTTDNCSGETYKAFVGATEIDPATYPFAKGETTVTWTVTDIADRTASDTQLVTVVDDEDPTITAPIAVTANTSDDDTGDCFTTVVLGSPTTSDNCPGETYEAYVGSELIDPATHLFSQGETTVTWKVTDIAGKFASAEQLVTVDDNEDPTIGDIADKTISGDENCAAVLGDYTLEATVEDNCDSGLTVTQDPAPGTPFSGTIQVTLTVTDEATNFATMTFDVSVEDTTDPTIADIADKTVSGDESGEAELSDYTQIATVFDNCDSQPVVTQEPASGEIISENTLVTLTVMDNSGNSNSTDFMVNVENDGTEPGECETNQVPMIIEITGPTDPVAFGTAVTLNASINDDNIKSAIWSISRDGINFIEEPQENVIGSSLGKTYNLEPGVYSVKLSIEDECGLMAEEVYEYVVVYDPNSGFVIGGGWIQSPPGAYTADPLLEGKASFGFVAKYKRGKNISSEVDGNTNFQFRNANFHFKSSAYGDMSLVISGHRATYKGVGSINGAGSYKFMIVAIDGDMNGETKPDKFRIKIWDSYSDNLFYDNHMGESDNSNATTTLEGGSIVIHKPKGKKAGTMESSQIQSVNYSIIQAYPNPIAADGIWINFSSEVGAQAFQAGLYDFNGRLLVTKMFEVDPEGGTHFWKFDHSVWGQGVYLLKLAGSSGEYQIHLMKNQ